MPNEWNQDEEDDRLPAESEEEGEDLPRMFSFDTDGDEIDHLCVERRDGSAWVEIGKLFPEETEEGFFDWLVEEGYAPTGKNSLQLRVYPVDTGNANLVSMTGKGQRGPKVMKIPCDNAELRAAIKRASTSPSDAPAARTPSPALAPEAMAFRIIADASKDTRAELAAERAARREEEARAREVERKHAKEALDLNQGIAQRGIQLIDAGYRGVMEQAKEAQGGVQTFMQQQFLLMQQQHANELANRKAEAEAAIARMDRELKHKELEMKNRADEREALRLEREAAAREERLRREEQDRKWEAAREAAREREEERRINLAMQMEQMRQDALARQEAALEKEAERQREHTALVLGMIQQRNEAAAPVAQFGAVGEFFKSLGIDPSEKIKALLGVGGDEEPAENISEVIGAAAPVIQTAITGLVDILTRRPAATEQPPPPPRALPQRDELPTPTGPLPSPADILRGQQTTPPVALPLPAETPAQQPPATPPAAPATEADPLPLAEMRAAREGMGAVIGVVSDNAEPAWDGLLTATLKDNPATAKLLQAWGVARCITDAEGPAGKIAALREHLLNIGMNVT